MDRERARLTVLTVLGDNQSGPPVMDREQLATYIVDALVGQARRHYARELRRLAEELERLRAVEAAAREVVEAEPTIPTLWNPIARLRAVLSPEPKQGEPSKASPIISEEASSEHTEEGRDG